MYHRTQNENGTLNTLCLDCFRTVATAVESENDLTRVEAAHVCPEKALALLLAQNSAVSAPFQLKH